MPKEALDPPQPSFIFRGHSAQIHAVHFTKNNTRLLTGDSDGWLVSWDVTYKRPVAVWKAHSEAILGLGSWCLDRIITYVWEDHQVRILVLTFHYDSHGRDNKILVWQLDTEAEGEMEKTLPVDMKKTSNSVAKKQPWLLHALPVNSTNFCSFAMCQDGMGHSNLPRSTDRASRPCPILIAVPNALDSSGVRNLSASCIDVECLDLLED